MSAIFGIYYPDNQPVDSANLGRMADILAHRGPDSVDIWCERAIGLGHRMLWTTPESLYEKLPLTNQTGDLVITADARIDNRNELITTLNFADFPAKEVTDSQLILAAYEKWGEDCPEKLLGAFAFVIWDGRKQLLFCARDHFGVKSFFYYYSPGRVFGFATEIKALFTLPEVSRQLNEEKVANHLAPVSENPTITFYQDILQLPASHCMTVSCEGTQLKSYWSLDPSRELRLGSDEAYVEAFREHFTEAVRCRLRSAFPVGSMLSGGLDSSSITCVARQLLVQNGGNQLRTFSAIFDQVSQSDERFFIETVLNQGNLEPYYLHADQVSPLTDLDRVLWHQDEACPAGNLYINWCLYGSASERGVRIMLDGFDGDTTVSHGQFYLVELARTGRWFRLAAELKEYNKNFDGPPWGWVLWHWVRRYGLRPMVSKSQVLTLIWQIWRALRPRKSYTKRSNWGLTFNSDFAQRLDLVKRDQVHLRPAQTEREHHFQLLTRALMPNTLGLLDRTAGAFSIEPRYPFFDRRLVEFCLALPPEQKMRRGWTRMILRRAMADILPKEIQWRRTKSDLGPGFEYGLLTFEQARLEEMIVRSPEVIEAYVDLTTLREAYQRFIAREPRSDDVVQSWRAISLALWLQYML